MFGPIRRTLYFLPISTISACNSGAPASAKPDGIRTAPGIFFSPHSIERARDEFRRDREHGGVDHAGHVLDALVGLVAQDLGGLRMDRIDVALVAAVDQVLHHRVADLAVLGGGADHGNRLRLHDAVHRRDDFLGRARRRARLVVEVDDDAHVGGDRVLLGGEHRIEIEFDDFLEIADELRHLDDDVGQRLAIDRIAAAHALEHVMGLDAVEHRQGVVLGRGRETEGDVLEHLDQHAAEAEGHQLAERSIGDRADDDFGAAGQHLLDLDAFDLGVGLVLLGVGQNGRVVRLDIGGGLDAHHHAAGFGLVQDVRRDDLHDHREAHVGRDLGRPPRRIWPRPLSEPECRRHRTPACLPAPSGWCGYPP